MQDITVTKCVEWDMGHRVPNHDSKCRNPHGHRYKCTIEVSGALVEAKGDSQQGMVLDFGHLKDILLWATHDKFDHGFMLHEDDPLAKCPSWVDHAFKLILVPYIPTAERIAQAVFTDITGRLKDKYGDRIWLSSLTIQETPTSSAIVRGKF